MRDFFVATFVLAAIALVRPMFAAESNKPLKSSMDAAARELFATKTYRELSRIPGRWRAELSRDERQALIGELISHLTSDDESPIVLPDGVVIDRFDWSKGYPEEVRRAREVVRHDIRTKAGRARWAIEELLLCELPQAPLPRASEKDRLAAMVATCAEIVRAMAPPIVDGTPAAPLAERLKVAASPTTAPRLLQELAKDGEADVRIAVAGNRSTPLSALDLLRNDTHAEVRKAATDNLSRARTLDALSLPENEVDSQGQKKAARGKSAD